MVKNDHGGVGGLGKHKALGDQGRSGGFQGNCLGEILVRPMDSSEGKRGTRIKYRKAGSLEKGDLITPIAGSCWHAGGLLGGTGEPVEGKWGTFSPPVSLDLSGTSPQVVLGGGRRWLDTAFIPGSALAPLDCFSVRKEGENLGVTRCHFGPENRKRKKKHHSPIGVIIKEKKVIKVIKRNITGTFKNGHPM